MFRATIILILYVLDTCFFYVYVLLLLLQQCISLSIVRQHQGRLSLCNEYKLLIYHVHVLNTQHLSNTNRWGGLCAILVNVQCKCTAIPVLSSPQPNANWGTGMIGCVVSCSKLHVWPPSISCLFLCLCSAWGKHIFGCCSRMKERQVTACITP